jgi:hypothetical protein
MSSELIFNRKKIMENASQYNISIQTEIEDSEGGDHHIEGGTNTNQMISEDIRNKNPITINKQEKINKSLFKMMKLVKSEIFLMIIIYWYHLMSIHSTHAITALLLLL